MRRKTITCASHPDAPDPTCGLCKQLFWPETMTSRGAKAEAFHASVAQRVLAKSHGWSHWPANCCATCRLQDGDSCSVFEYSVCPPDDQGAPSWCPLREAPVVVTLEETP